MPLHVSSTCAYHQEVKIVLYSIWYRHTCRWPSRAQVESGLQSSCTILVINQLNAQILVL